MTFEQILVFHRIVQSGSFKTASLEMNKTQPAISFSIKKLEEELGVSLFDRTQYRPVLTPFGTSFYEKTLSVIENMKDLEGLKTSFIRQEEPELKIAIDGISPLSELLSVFKKNSEQFIHTKINLDFDILFEVENKVLDQDFVFGITHFIKNKNQLEVLPLTKVRMAPVMNADLFKERELASLDQLKLLDQIVLGEKVPSNTNGFGLLEGGKKWRVTDNNFKREIIMAGLGWGHLPFHTIEREITEGRLTLISMGEINIKELDIYLIKSRKKKLGPVANHLWNELSALHQK